MKVWEENWYASGKDVGMDVTIPVTSPHALAGDFTCLIANCHTEAQAKLAAQAPAMARLLLEFEREQCGCPACHAFGPRPLLPDGTPDYTPGRGMHSAGCRLVAALRAAGVLPPG
jgi:hypothetical protein